MSGFERSVFPFGNKFFNSSNIGFLNKFISLFSPIKVNNNKIRIFTMVIVVVLL